MNSTPTKIALQDRFVGCLLGLAVGDALGALFEAQSQQHIRQRCPTPADILRYPRDTLMYTDDTQMAIGITESLIEHREIKEQYLCEAFVSNYVAARGYGRGARAILDAMEDGRDYRGIAEQYFPGGSLGNGAAMRIAPLGLFFRDDMTHLLEQAELASLPTHRHPLGIEGAQLLALTVALVSQVEFIDRGTLFERLQNSCQSEEFRNRLQLAQEIEHPDRLIGLGNGIKALDSVVTAITSFTLTPDSYSQTIANVIYLGGDTDTLAAMAGAVSGTYLGSEAIPEHLIELLEEYGKGRTYLIELAKRLFEVYQEQHSRDAKTVEKR